MCIYKYTRVYTGCMAVPIFRFPSYTVKRGKPHIVYTSVEMDRIE